MLAKILGKVRSYLLSALLKGMRFRSKRYLCWQQSPANAWVVVGFLNVCKFKSISREHDLGRNSLKILCPWEIGQI